MFNLFHIYFNIIGTDFMCSVFLAYMSMDFKYCMCMSFTLHFNNVASVILYSMYVHIVQIYYEGTNYIFYIIIIFYPSKIDY